MSDPLDRFSDLAKDYPGSRTPVNRGGGKKEPAGGSSEESWDANPVTYIVGGEVREFFTIGHLARALGRSTVTIRSWENKGVFPRSGYRSPRPKTTPTFGSEPKGKRLWTRRQIEGLLRICEEERVITDPHKKPPSKTFTARATELFLRLRLEEQQKQQN